MRARGISPILATIIVIALTIFAGYLLYNYFWGASKSAGSIEKLLILPDTRIVNVNGTSYLILHVRNQGNQPISIESIMVGEETVPVNNAQDPSTVTSNLPANYTVCNVDTNTGTIVLPVGDECYAAFPLSGSYKIGVTYSMTIMTGAGNQFNYVLSVKTK